MSGPRPELPGDIALRVRKAQAAGASAADIEAKLRSKYGVGLDAVPFADVSTVSSSQAAPPSERSQRMAARRKELGFAEDLGFTTATDGQYAKQSAERRALIHGITGHLDNVLKGAAGAVTGEGYSAVKAKADAMDAADRQQFPSTGAWETAGQISGALLMPGGPILGSAVMGGVPTAADGGSVGDVAKDAAIGGGLGLAGVGAGKAVGAGYRALKSPAGRAVAKDVAQFGIEMAFPRSANIAKRAARTSLGKRAGAWLESLGKGAAPVADDAAAAIAPEVRAASDAGMESAIQRGLTPEAGAPAPTTIPGLGPAVEAPIVTPPAPALPPEVAAAAQSVSRPTLVTPFVNVAQTISKMGRAELEKEITRRSAPAVIEKNRAWLEAAVKDLERRAAADAARIASPQKQKSAAALAKRNTANGLK